MKTQEQYKKIKVICVGGGGCIVVCTVRDISKSWEAKQEAEQFELHFCVCDTDSIALEVSLIDDKVLIGSNGLGAGGNPVKARDAAQKDIEYIRAMLNGTDTVFIVCTLGGGTGAGATPIIVQEALSKGIQTFVLAIFPFDAEGIPHLRDATEALTTLKSLTEKVHVVQLNDILKGCGDLPMGKALGIYCHQPFADYILTQIEHQAS